MATNAITEAAIALAWSQWGDLGVPGTSETRHSFLNVDLEALVWLTATLDDARLRQEAMDWLLQYGRLISISRLRPLAKLWPNPVLDDMLATVRAESKDLRWMVTGHPLPFRPRRHARLDLKRRSCYTLRLRTLLGVDARADVLAALLCARSPLDHSELTDRAGYSKRAIIDAADTLVEGGFIDRLEFRNRFLHSVDAEPWTGLLGAEAPTWIPWRDVYLVLQRAARTERMHPDLETVEAHVAWANLGRELTNTLARIELFSPQAMPAGEISGRDSFVKFANRIASGIE